MDEITWVDITNSAIAVGALLFSLYNFWYSKFKKSKLRYICTKWTALGASENKADGSVVRSAFFLLDISIRNEGAKSQSTRDIFLKITDKDNNVYHFNPLAIFDFQYYSSNLGRANMLKAQKGIVPLPIEIKGNTTYKFDDYVLFLPYGDSQKNGLNIDNTPLTIEVLVNDDSRFYKKITEQLVTDKDVAKLGNGNFSAFETSSILSDRETYLVN